MPNTTIPSFVAEVKEALGEFFLEGATVQDLAEHIGASYPAARRALSYAIKEKAVAKRKGKSDGSKNRPPDIYFLVVGEDDGGVVEQDPIEQEPIQEAAMPDIVEHMSQPEESADVQEAGQALPGELDGAGEGGESSPPPAPVPQPPAPARVQQPKGSSAHAVQAFNRREVMAGQKLMEARTGHEPGQTLKVERIDPLPEDFPQEEKGVLGAAFELAAVGDLEEYIRMRYGGGTYQIHTCDASGNLWGGRPATVTIMGLPVPQTPRGRVWLQDFLQKAPAADGRPPAPAAPDMLSILEIMDRRAATQRQESTQQFQQTLQLLAPKPPDTAGIKELHESHAKEMDKVRSDAERRVLDIKEAMALQVGNLEKQLSALREDMRTMETSLTNAFTKEKAELQTAHLAKVAEVQAAAAKDLASCREQASRDLATMKEQTAKDIKAADDLAKLNTKIESLQRAPKDIGYEVQKGMIPEIIEIATAQAKKAAGVVDEDEGPETMMDALKGVVAEAGPDVMKRLADGIMTIVQAKTGSGPAGAAPPRPGIPQRPAQPPRRPGAYPVRPASPVPPPRGPAQPPTLPVGGSFLLRERTSPAVPPPPPPVLLTEEQQAALISQGITPAPAAPPIQGTADEPGLDTGEPPAEEPVLSPVQQATALRLSTFFEVLYTEMQIDSEATEVWTVPIPGADMTFEDLYYKLPGAARKAMEAAEPEKAWPAVLAALHVTPADDPLLHAIQDHLDGNPAAHVWLTEFFEAGPWNEVEDEEPEEEGKAPGGDVTPPATGPA